ncbi:MAG TPA: FAD-dependent thymidylate synthase, partial [Verrucomicrobiae bacterium]|nr:FAD-dependent thymidylate synthase [Verrucomicrobiae bacterium]
MKVTQVAICPSEASKRAGRPALTPELLAASGARYSRNNEGLEAILSKIDPDNLEKSVDSIFRMVDYGHQSIADMVPVAMFIDGISIWLAYYIWTLCPTAGGQESSTRYIKISIDGLIPPEDLGIPQEEIPEWRNLMGQCFEAYQASLEIWESLASDDPNLMGIPQALLKDTSESARKKVTRMKRNYAFDRSRYFLPVAAATNVMLLMSARAWVNLCQHLLSHTLPEPRRLGEFIRNELEISAPRLTKYARFTDSVRQMIEEEFRKVILLTKKGLNLPSQGPA